MHPYGIITASAIPGEHLTMRITKRIILRVIVACWLAAFFATVASAIEQQYLGWLSNLGGSLQPPVSPYAPTTWEYFRNTLLMASCIILPPCLLGSLLAIVIILIIPDPTHDTETHCRKCSYILKGLSKPQCPECGEAI